MCDRFRCKYILNSNVRNHSIKHLLHNLNWVLFCHSVKNICKLNILNFKHDRFIADINLLLLFTLYWTYWKIKSVQLTRLPGRTTKLSISWGWWYVCYRRKIWSYIQTKSSLSEFLVLTFKVNTCSMNTHSDSLNIEYVDWTLFSSVS